MECSTHSDGVSLACTEPATETHCAHLHPERDVEGMASLLEAAPAPDLDRIRRVDALNGYGIRQEGMQGSQGISADVLASGMAGLNGGH